MQLDYSAVIWLALALAIVCVFIQKNVIATLFLYSTLCLSVYFERLTIPTGLGITLLFLIAWKSRYASPRYQFPNSLFIVICCVALFSHRIPGFENLLVLNNVETGPESVLFSMYLNLDKPLAFFILLLAHPTLLGVRGAPNYKAITLTSIPLLCLLPLAVYVGALKFEPSLPVWWWLFALSNLLFTCVAEEALFRGYLQQKLCHRFGAVAGISFASILFGLAHFAGGSLLMIFAALAGLGYGLIFYWSQRLWVAVFAHFAFNFIHLLFFTYPAAIG